MRFISKINLILIFFAFIFLIGITGCTQKNKITTLKFTSWGSKSEVEILKPLIEEFEQENPDISIEFIHTPQNYFQKLHLLAASNLMPDVVFVNNMYGPLYAENKLFLDLNEFLKKDENLSHDDFFEESLNSLTYRESLYALPRDVSNLVIFYNKDIFDKYEIPYPSRDWTIEEFIEISKKLTKDNNNDGRTDLFGISFREDPLFWLPYLLSEGGGILSEDLEMIILDNPESISAIQQYSDLRNKHHVAPTKSEAGSSTMAQLFMREKLAMHLSGRWFVPIYRQEIKFNWDIASFPKGKNGSIVGSDASGWAISSKTKYPEQAWKFISFLASKDSIEKITANGLITPARTDVAESDVFLDKTKPPFSSEIFIEAIKNSKPTPVNENYHKITDSLQNMLEPVWAGKNSAKEVINESFVEKLETKIK